ncbi:unnamed protein product [Dicrocoelium dendriticum]|nr:unnamed protein product [Dicrocoelium dendriticum]
MNFSALLLSLIVLLTISHIQSDSTENPPSEANDDDLSELLQDLGDNLGDWARKLLNVSTSPSIKNTVRNGVHLVRTMLDMFLEGLEDTDNEEKAHEEL